MAEPDERPTAEVCDEERDLRRTDDLGEQATHHIGGRHRRSILDRGQQLAHVQPGHTSLTHESERRAVVKAAGPWSAA